MKWEGIILDWAGTTVDFGSMAPVEVFKEIFLEAGVPATDEEVRKPMGMLKWDHIKTMLAMPRIKEAWTAKYGAAPTDSDVNRLYGRFEPMVLKVLSRGVVMKPYVCDTMDELRNRGYKLGSTTGFNDAMMALVVPSARAQGYEPDYWVTPDSTDGHGRPYPYMVFLNMMHFGWSETGKVLKVGDTVADIEEGKHAGCKTAGILVGSSVMGMTRSEYDALSEEERKAAEEKAAAVYQQAGADYILRDIRDLLTIVE